MCTASARWSELANTGSARSALYQVTPAGPNRCSPRSRHRRRSPRRGRRRRGEVGPEARRDRWLLSGRLYGYAVPRRISPAECLRARRPGPTRPDPRDHRLHHRAGHERRDLPLRRERRRACQRDDHERVGHRLVSVRSGDAHGRSRRSTIRRPRPPPRLPRRLRPRRLRHRPRPPCRPRRRRQRPRRPRAHDAPPTTAPPTTAPPTTTSRSTP